MTSSIIFSKSYNLRELNRTDCLLVKRSSCSRGQQSHVSPLMVHIRFYKLFISHINPTVSLFCSLYDTSIILYMWSFNITSTSCQFLNVAACVLTTAVQYSRVNVGKSWSSKYRKMMCSSKKKKCRKMVPYGCVIENIIRNKKRKRK